MIIPEVFFFWLYFGKLSITKVRKWAKLFACRFAPCRRSNLIPSTNQQHDFNTLPCLHISTRVHQLLTAHACRKTLVKPGLGQPRLREPPTGNVGICGQKKIFVFVEDCEYSRRLVLLIPPLCILFTHVFLQISKSTLSDTTGGHHHTFSGALLATS